MLIVVYVQALDTQKCKVDALVLKVLKNCPACTSRAWLQILRWQNWISLITVIQKSMKSAIIDQSVIVSELPYYLWIGPLLSVACKSSSGH